MSLESIRGDIDALDREIVALLNRRLELAGEIGRLKRRDGAAVYVPKREEEVLRKLAEMNPGPLREKALRAIYREIMSAAIALEKPTRIAFLGPEATYTHQAALKKFGASLDYNPYVNIADVFQAVEKGDADYGVIPVENSTEGAVFHSLDLLAETELKIVAQIHLEIAHSLFSRSAVEEIVRVYSKDQALGQCRQWLQAHLPNAELIADSSTAAAVRRVREEAGAAAIAGSLAGRMYDVPEVAANIQDRAENITRFLVIGRETTGPVENGENKTSLVVSIRDEVGALQKTIQPFSSRSINLCKIESRPSRRKPWDYYFFIDVIGHYEDAPVREAIRELEGYCPFVKWLGSYPNSR